MLRASTENNNDTESTSSEKTEKGSIFSAKTPEKNSSDISRADTDILYENLSVLHTAYKYVTPIIDDIVCQATSYTQAEFQKILESNSAICSISLSEYSKAIRASEIISKVNSELELNRDFNYLPLQQAVINTVYTYSMDELAKGIVNIADRIYIDRDLMKKLMDLHELITETIKQVNIEMEEIPQKINATTIERAPVNNVSSTNVKDSKLKAVKTGNVMNKPLMTFTVEPAKSIRMEQPINKTLTVIPGDHVLQNDSATIINSEVPAPSIASEKVYIPDKQDSTNKNIYKEEEKEKEDNIGEVRLSINEVKTIEVTEDINDEPTPPLEIMDEPLTLTEIVDEPLPPSLQKESISHTEPVAPPLQRESMSYKEPSIDNIESEPAIIPKTASEVLIEEEVEPYLDDFEIISVNSHISESEEVKAEGDSVPLDPDMAAFYPPYDAQPPKESPKDSCKLRKLFYELSLSVNCLKKKCVLCTSHPNLQSCGKAIEARSISDNTVNLPKSFDDFKEEDALNTQQEIIKYLKELYDIKKVLNRIDNPELVVDTSIKNKEQCCMLHAYPHIHAKLNGISVIIKMTQDTIDVLLAESYTIKENKCACSSKALNDKVVLTSNNDKSTNLFPSQEVYNPVIDESICSLPYLVTKRSLPNIKNSVYNAEVDSFKSNMTSQIISFQNEMIKQQLLAVGVDNLVNIAKPAKCCRKLHTNEITEDDPYRASLNSLPLTNSDMLTIKQLVDNDPKCMNTYSLQSKFAYYTNFQENFASNIEYFIPKTRVIEVRFFEIFRFEEKDKKSKLNRIKTENNNPWNIFEILRRFTSPDNRMKSNQAETVNVYHEVKRVKNQRSQTEESKSDRIYTSNTKPHKPKRKKLVRELYKSQKDSCVMCNMTDTSSLSPKNYADTLSGIYEIGSDGKVRTKPRNNSTRSTGTISSLKTSQNLGTIYEFEEKYQNSSKDKNKEKDSIYNMLNQLELTESYRNFIASDGAMKAFENNSLGPEQFWNLYFETKKCNKAVNCKKSESSNELTNHKFLTAQQKIKLKKKKSKIPKRIRRKQNNSDSSSTYSTMNSKKYKIKLKQTNSKIKISEESNESLGTKNKTDTCEKIKKMKTKIFFTDVLEEAAKCHEFLPDSIQSLRVLASKNGPGYITVLHPVCGCPEVSIFIPCYCNDPNNSEIKKPSLTSNNAESLVGSNDGRHIILPKSCRINGSDNCL